jgi:predicted RNA-binding Zn-ribbon protein involved in translation (DUF1610 family)
MHCYDVAPSRLPSLLLPCPHCGHRMVITAVEPALFVDGATANDLQDVTHSCEQCGTELTRTVRPSPACLTVFFQVTGELAFPWQARSDNPAQAPPVALGVPTSCPSGAARGLRSANRRA